jgi:hypothetical protein
VALPTLGQPRCVSPRRVFSRGVQASTRRGLLVGFTDLLPSCYDLGHEDDLKPKVDNPSCQLIVQEIQR